MCGEHGFLIPVFLFALLLVGDCAVQGRQFRGGPQSSPHPYERLKVAA